MRVADLAARGTLDRDGADGAFRKALERLRRRLHRRRRQGNETGRRGERSIAWQRQILAATRQEATRGCKLTRRRNPSSQLRRNKRSDGDRGGAG